MKIEDILKLISDAKFEEAEDNINKEIKNTQDLREKAKLNALLGEIYISDNNRNKSARRAKLFYEESINIGTPVSISYYRYDDLEDDNTIAIRYLKKGISEFSSDVVLYGKLFKREDKIEKIKIIKEVIEKDIKDKKLYNDFIEYAFEKENYELARILSEKAEKLNDNENISNECNFIKISSSILLNDLQLKDVYIKELEDIIEKDLKNVLKYSPYLLLIYLENQKGNIKRAIELLMKIPIKTGIDNFYGWDNLIEIDLEILYRKIFDSLEQTFLNEELMKVKALKYIYLNTKYENFEGATYNTKDIKDFIKVLDKFPENKDIYSAIYSMYGNLEKYADAVIFAIDSSTKNYEIKELFGKLKVKYCIKNAKTQELVKIVDKLVQIITNIDKYDCSISYIMLTFVDDLIEELHERKMYDYVYTLTKGIDINEILKLNNIFEIAYAYKDDIKRKKLYEHLIEKEPNISAYHNNIGTIYKKQGDLIKAKECFKKAYELDNEDEIAEKNLKDTNEKIEELYRGYENVKNENTWILNKLRILYIQANDDSIITCSTKEQSKILQCSPEKAYEMISNFISNGYIIKINSNDEYRRSQYRVNDLVRDYINEQTQKIEENKEYEEICNKLNIDYLKEIGYSEILIEKLETIQDEDVLKVMKRDFKECAIAMASCQQKTATILAGSMSEALLYYVVKNKGINKYKITRDGEAKEIRLKDMGLADLLEVASSENIIHRTDYHLTQFVRDYRNLIHPSTEIRKKIRIDDDEVELIWNILKKLIKDIL